MATKRSNILQYILLFAGGALLYLAAVLPFLIYHGGIFFYYGDYNVQQVPFYILAHRAVRGGRFFWNPYIDLGSSMGASMSFYLWGSPFFWLTIPFSEKMIPYILPFVMSLRYGTAMAASYAYIRRNVRSNFWAVIGSLLYTFSGFQACNIVFQHFHDATAFFPLYLLTFDDAVGKNRTAGFTLMTALMSVINYYFFFGQAIFILIYYIVRYCPSRDPHRIAGDVIRVLLSGILGLLISAFFLVQSVYGLSGNSRLNDYINGYGIFAFDEGVTPLAIIKSLFMVPDIIAKPTLFSGEQVKNGSLAAYLPCFSLTGVIAYMKVFRRSWKSKMIAVCCVMAFIHLLNSVFSAFNSEYYARWFYMPILIMAAMTARALESAGRTELMKAARVTVIITVLIMLSALVPVIEKGKTKWFSVSSNNDLLVIEIAATAAQLLILVFLLIILPNVSGLSKYRKPALLIATIFCCLLTNLAVLYNGNSLIARTGGVKWRKQMLDSKPELPDTSSFLRVETDGTSTNYEMVWGYPTIHCFESTVNPSIFSFYRKIGMIRTVESTLPIDRAGARALLSVRYYIENTLVKPSETLEEKGGIVGYDDYTDTDGYRIYENSNYIPMGFTFDSFIRDAEYSSMKKGEMTDRLLVRDIILTEEQCARYGKYMDEDRHADEQVMSDQEFARYCRERAESSCKDFRFTLSGFTAEADLPEDNLVFFSVPYDPGFTAAVDGAEVTIEKVDGGLMAIPVPAGKHSIEFRYLPVGIRMCSYISAAAVIAFIIPAVRSRKTNVLAMENKP